METVKFVTPDWQGTEGLPLAREDAADLQAKYSEMLSMRLAHDSGTEDRLRVRSRMIALATRFPGALREIDRLALDDIRCRIARLDAVLSGRAAREPWMAVLPVFHRGLRGALVAKRWLAERRPGSDGELLESLALGFVDALKQLPFGADASAWADRLQDVANPPRGSITLLVMVRLAEAFQTTPAEVRRVVHGSLELL